MYQRVLFSIILCTMLAGAAPSTAPTALAAGEMAVIDQANVVDVRLLDSIQLLGPIGQEFTPSLAGLDVVELWTEDFMLFNGRGSDLVVHIREKTIYGPILATSQITSLPDLFSGVTRFDFSHLVPLQRGYLYVIEVVVLSGDNWLIGDNWSAGSGGGPDSTYPGGNWIIAGESLPNNDLWFREGLADATPQAQAYCKNALWSYLVRADGSGYKNQGDCLQYYITGK